MSDVSFRIRLGIFIKFGTVDFQVKKEPDNCVSIKFDYNFSDLVEGILRPYFNFKLIKNKFIEVDDLTPGQIHEAVPKDIPFNIEITHIYPIFKPRLIVFDFHLTLTSTANILDAALFKKFTQYLLKTGCRVAIASYGTRYEINNVLNRVFVEANQIINVLPTARNIHPFTIVTPPDISEKWKECHKPPEGLGKVNMLIILSKRFGISPGQILLVDDQEKNYSEALMQGYHAVHIFQGAGIRGILEYFFGEWAPIVISTLDS